MYLYVPWTDDEDAVLEGLPEGLKNITGSLDKIMDLELSPERKLARANTQDVITALHDKGFYLQSPPNALLRKDDSMLYDPSDTF